MTATLYLSTFLVFSQTHVERLPARSAHLPSQVNVHLQYGRQSFQSFLALVVELGHWASVSEKLACILNLFVQDVTDFLHLVHGYPSTLKCYGSGGKKVRQNDSEEGGYLNIPKTGCSYQFPVLPFKEMSMYFSL